MATNDYSRRRRTPQVADTFRPAEDAASQNAVSEKVNTSISIEMDLQRQVRVFAAQHNIKLSEVFANGARLYMAQHDD
ncbi:hypothetical protein Bra3105_00275 [Brachybacterium halotolerans subsp. kimchii]|uniref:hypothetical protein n=1 Tax=Brachybacterium halotolerans TaxID=2795215 RepID=UPI001E299C22|nr:hypothetical protein [Brachybacterium halotolerans]UEJ82807.1 hypothetical protein Bra3105_00275 [Brachybacterium halotolerans subsp. kimchii]